MRKFLGDLSGTSMRDETGYYKWPVSDGVDRSYISVTAVLSVLNKPGLNRWYAARERDFVASRIEAVYRGEIKGRELLAELRDEKKWKPHAEVYRNVRAELGSRVHHEITKYVLARESGARWDLAADCDAMLVSHMASFHKWFEKEKPNYLFVEGPVFNDAHGYAGTSDALIEFRDGKFVVDYKISPETNRDHALQVAAYRNAHFIGIPATKQKIEMPRTDGGKVLLVHPDGCKLFSHKGDTNEYEAFIHALRLWQWRNQEYSQPKEDW